MTLAQALLSPLTIPYGSWVRLRALGYRVGAFRKKRIEGTVISVGNLTVGGTGKTPMVLWIAQRLLAEGANPAILTRGYRGRDSGSSGESGKNGSDEVQILKNRLGGGVLFGVGADRFARSQELARLGAKWFVLDDGFQHQQLARDADIVLIDANNPFGGGHLLPAGRLREPKSALARAGVIVISRSQHAPALEAAIRRESGAPIFYAHTALDSVRSLRSSYPGEEIAVPTGWDLFAFCGVGNGSAFFSDLRTWDFRIVGQKAYRDHHRYTSKDVANIETAARNAGADALICTEKDAVNLAGTRMPSLELFYARISLQIDRGDDFWGAVMNLTTSRSRR